MRLARKARARESFRQTAGRAHAAVGCLPASVKGPALVARLARHVAAPLEAAAAVVNVLDVLGVVPSAAAQQVAPSHPRAAVVAHAALRAQRPCPGVALAEVRRLLRVHLKFTATNIA